MNIEQRNYGVDTWVRQSFPWGAYIGARVLCSDGKVRNVKRIAETADTFFSVPAAVKVQGRTVSGYVTFETLQGFSTPTDDDPTVVKFRAHTYGRNADLLPGGVYRAFSVFDLAGLLHIGESDCTLLVDWKPTGRERPV